MTAEIAILNKGAVALAADSAVTIGRGANSKIYNTVNKIFELSDEQPIALMVYGNLEFMGLPIETIAKMYRRDVGNKKDFAQVKGCADSLIEYLESNIPYKSEDLRKNTANIIFHCFDDLNREIEQEIWADITSRGKLLKSKVNSIAQVVIQRRISELSGKSPAEPFRPGNLARILAGHDDLVDLIASDVFKRSFVPTAGTMKQLRRLAKYELHRAPLSASRTGIVVCGFGVDELCPSLEHIEIDGIIGGKLKRSTLPDINIGRDSVGADVRAFAQHEMVARFLWGIDPTYEEYLDDLTGEVLKQFAREVIKLIRQITKQSIKPSTLDPVIDALLKHHTSMSDRRKQQEYESNILNMVEFMPKQELARFAESLIDITSLKRRVSAELETVGGEVDVAVISKAEGLVWIKRKHYFPGELNPRFYNRHYRNQG